MSETLLDTKPDIQLNLNVNTKPKYYRLKVNINGFRLEDIRVSLIDANKENDRVQVKISAFRNLRANNQDTTKEYVKYYDIFKSKTNIKTNSMKFYLDQKNPLFLVIEFLSNSDENVYINLDDSCESLVELAAKSLLNIKNIEELRQTIENPSNSPLSPDLDGIFSPNLIKELNIATKTTFTPIILILDQSTGLKKIRIEVSLPSSIRSVSLEKNDSNIKTKTPDSNHVKIKFDGFKLNLEAITVNENTTSTFSKEFNIPKGTNLNQIKYHIDENKSLLIIEAPYID